MKNLTKFTGIVAVAALMSFFSACSSTAEKKENKDSLEVAGKSREIYLANIEQAEKAMRADSSFSSRLALDALKAYTDFTTLFPKDSNTAEYLFNAGQLAQSTGNYKQAALFFETIIDQHKGYKNYVAVC
ncbi:MAG: tetratricopeptide repeat protein, partial [Bacteroidia bacterium]